MDPALIFKIVIPLVAAAAADTLLQRVVRVPKNIQSSRTTTYFSVLKSALRVVTYATAVYGILLALKVNVTPLFASAGVVGVVMGLGLRSFIEDFFTGIFILTEDTIRVGDYVDIAGSEGVTESLGIRTVRIRDKNGALHIFPNREIKKIVNYSKRQARVIIDVPIKSNQPVDAAIAALEAALSDLKKDPSLGEHILSASRIEGVEAVNPGHMVLRVLILTRASERWNAGRTYRRIAVKQLEKAKILLA